MSSKIKLKKSSIAGRVPAASDLDYGEVAINIADGKLYFKNSSNIVQSFEAGSFVDSASVIGLIDSAYIQARQTSEAGGLDSAEVNLLVADGLQHAFSRILVDGQFDVLADSTQDGLTFEAGHNITITTAPNDDTITFSTSSIGADSVTSLIDSSYVDARLPARAVTLTDSQDLSNKILTSPVLNSPVFGTGAGAYTFPTTDGNANQVLGTDGSGTLSFVNQSVGLDSNTVFDIVDSSYVGARQDFAYSSLTGVPTTFSPIGVDSSATIALIDSAYVQARQTSGGGGGGSGTVDSADIIAIVDSAYVQARQSSVTSGGLDFGTISSPAGFTLDLGAI